MKTFLFTLFSQVNSNSLPSADFDASIASISKIVFAVAGMLSVIFIAIGGFKYTVSNGDPQGIASAKNTIIAAIVGLILAVSAFSIVNFVFGRL